MQFLEWNDKYIMGEKKIDEQHKWLFKLSNEIYNLIESGVDDNEHYRELFMALVDYSIEHFIYEEVYIEGEDFPGLEEHIAQHKKFSEKLKELAQNIDDNTHIKDIGEFVSTWLLEHVIKEDMKYKRFIDNK